VEDVVELVPELREHGVVCDRALDELDPAVVRHVLALGREQVVDHEHTRGVAGEQLARQVASNEAGPADDEGRRPCDLGH
jgi:hypothetical protein